jgi:hypothetical protein
VEEKARGRGREGRGGARRGGEEGGSEGSGEVDWIGGMDRGVASGSHIGGAERGSGVSERV